MTHDIAGYDFESHRLGPSPVTLAELDELQRTLGWTSEDERWLARAAPALTRHAEDLVNDWRAQIGTMPFLSHWFGDPGEATDRYRAAVKKRFVQWVIDTCARPRDQAWLDYAEEIGLRHTPLKKNTTDAAQGRPSKVPLRYVIAFAWPVISGTRRFLTAEGTAEEVDAMQAAWGKLVLLQIALWSRPFVHEGWW